MILKHLLTLIGLQADLPTSVLNCNVTNIIHDSHQATKNSLFVAICGFNTDGHLYLEQANENGAIAAVTEKRVKSHLPQIVVDNTRETLAKLAGAFYGYPAQKLTMIGITGTNGKTTTTRLIHYLLNDLINTGLIGSIDIRYSNRIINSSTTTPDALDLHYYLGEMVKTNTEAVVMEVSSHGLELDRTAGITYHLAAITNISPDHFDLHHNLANYIISKQKLFCQTDQNGFVFFNCDDPLAAKTTSVCKTPILTYGQSPEADLQIISPFDNQYKLCFSQKAQSLLALEKGVPVNIRTNLIGLHNAYNSALAIGICLAAKCPLEIILERLPKFPGVHRRLQTIYRGHYTVIDDYAHNPHGITAAINAVTRLNPSRLILVCSIRGNRGPQINYEIGHSLAENVIAIKVPVILIISESADVVSEKDQVSPQERNAFITDFARYGYNIDVEPYLSTALKKAVKAGQAGDIILILGAQGMDAAQQLIYQYLPVTVSTTSF